VKASQRDEQAARRERQDTEHRAADLAREARQHEAAAADLASAAQGGGIADRVIGAGLGLARLPLTAIEKFTGKSGSQWAPAAGFASIEAGVMQVAGSLLRDQSLSARARSRQSAAAHSAAASDSSRQAEQLRSEAEQREKTKVAQAHTRRQEAEQTAAQRTRTMDAEAEQRTREAQQTTAKRKARARASAVKADQGVGKRARTDELATATDEQKAAIERKRAVRKTQNVIDLDEKIEQTKQARKQR
jgi:hypothetical protein